MSTPNPCALYVPMQITARPVESAGVTTPPGKGGTATIQAPPAPGAASLEPGVHVSWALPDAFMRGHTDADGELRFPDVPDQWLIVRLSPAVENGLPSPTRRVLSRFLLNSWSGSISTPGPDGTFTLSNLAKVGQRLTAMGLVDPAGELLPDELRPAVAGLPEGPEAFVGYYPVARRRFGFYDDLQGVPAGPITYTVIGWFQDRARDPLAPIADDAARLAKIAELGWKMEGVTFATLPGQGPAKRSAPSTPAGTPPKGPSTGPGGGPGGPSDPPGGGCQWPWQAPLPEPVELARVPGYVLVHGAMFDVPWRGVGGRYVTQEGTDPSTTAEITVGDSLADAMSSLLTSESEMRWLLEILQGRGLRDLKDIDGLSRIQEILHEAGFYARRTPTLAEAMSALAPDPVWKSLSEQAYRDSLVVQAPGTQGVDEWGGKDKVPPKQPRDNKDALEARWWRPNPPILMIGNAGRAFFYGHDGRFDLGGQLLCRAAPRVVGRLSFFLQLSGGSGSLLFNEELHGMGTPAIAPICLASTQGIAGGFSPVNDERAGAMSTEVELLLNELLLIDPCSAPAITEWVAQRTQLALKFGPEVEAAMRAQIDAYFRLEATSLWLDRLPETVSSDVARISGYRSYDTRAASYGYLPSGMAVSPYTGGWSTLYTEYQGIFLPTDKAVNTGWALGAADHSVQDTATWGLSGVVAIPIKATRCAVGDAGPRTLADGLERLLKDPMIAAEMSEEAVSQLTDQVKAIRDLNVLSASLTAVDECLVRANKGLHLRAGALSLVSVKLYDIYGRVVSLNVNALRAPADSVKSFSTGPLKGKRAVVLPPRLLGGARTSFTLQTPVSGYLLYDYVDRAIEVLDTFGVSQGQLRHNGVAVVWEPAPGEEATVAEGAGGNIEDEDLRRLVQGMLKAGLMHRAAAARGVPDPVTALIALLDLVRGTVDRRGDTEEFLALLTGAPIAVVRATVGMEYEPTYKEVVARQLDAYGRPHPSLPDRHVGFPGGLRVRLGDLSQLDDGVLGYFLDGSPELLQSAVPADVVVDLPWQQADAVIGSIPSIKADATLELRPGAPVTVTLLLAPGASAALTTGILPRKRAGLSREALKEGLAHLAPTFSVGALLIDPELVSLPVSDTERLDWEWIGRDRPAAGTGGWTVATVTPSTAEASTSGRPLQLREGWLRIKLSS